MNKGYSVFRIILLLTIIFFSFWSCSPARKAIREPLKEQGAAYLFDKLQTSKPRFQTLSARASLAILSNKSDFTMKAQFRIVKDSAIWISLSPLLGIEAVRILLTPDSVKFMDRINNTYFVGKYSFFSEFYQIDFDYDILESILLGVDFRCYDGGEMKAGVDYPYYTLSTANRRKLKRYVKSHADSQRILLQDVWLDPTTFRIRRLHMKEANRDARSLLVEYESFVALDSTDQIAQDLNIKLHAEDNITLGLHFTKFETNPPVTLPFNVPRSYVPIHFGHE